MDCAQLLWVAQGHKLPGAGVKNHRHPYYHMLYITAGQAQFLVQGEEYTLHPGQCLLIPKNVDHAYSNPNDTLMEYMEVKFSLPQGVLETAIAKSGTIISDNAIIGPLVSQILHEFSDLGSLADEAAISYLVTILNLLCQDIRYGKKPKSRFIDSTDFSSLSQRIIQYLENHFHTDVSLDDLADSIDYNKSYLCVAFKRDTGTTILDCLNTIRIRRAAELIVYSDHSISQVATQCGFASVSHFNRVFLKYVGTTPGQCRRAHPGDIMFEDPEKANPLEAIPNRFIYSVLAHKQITLEMATSLADDDEDE